MKTLNLPSINMVEVSKNSDSGTARNKKKFIREIKERIKFIREIQERKKFIREIIERKKVHTRNRREKKFIREIEERKKSSYAK